MLFNWWTLTSFWNEADDMLFDEKVSNESFDLNQLLGPGKSENIIYHRITYLISNQQIQCFRAYTIRKYDYQREWAEFQMLLIRYLKSGRSGTTRIRQQFNEKEIHIFLFKVMAKPNQPRSFNFPKRLFGKKNPEHRSFNAQWFNAFPWLHDDEVNWK